MAVAKRKVKYRITQFPEKVLVADQALDHALLMAKFSQDVPLLDFADLLPEYRDRPAVGPAYDPPSEAAEDGTLLMDKGKVVTAATWAELRAKVARMVRLSPEDYAVRHITA